LPPVIMNAAFAERFHAAYNRCRVIMFSAPCGCGKTTVIPALLSGQNYSVRSAAEDGFLLPVVPGTKTLVLDDLHLVTDTEEQNQICQMIRSHPNVKFLLLSRGTVPGWLMPFGLAGVMETFETGDFMLGEAAARKMLEGNGIHVPASMLPAIQRDIRGYPVAMMLLCRHLEREAVYSAAVLDAVKRDLFAYFDEVVFRRFDTPLRRLLLSLAPFESFTVEMAAAVSGEAQVGALLDTLAHTTNMLLHDGVSVCRIYAIFREFLVWKMEHSYTQTEKREFFKRAGLYYELCGDITHALECYASGGENRKISELLEKHAALHPGVGHYYETEPYYRSLPREEVLSSPSLMCGMSMLCALTLDFEASEMWYQELQNYTARLRRTDTEYRDARSKLSYLDIALPQRGSKGLIELIGTVFRVMTDKKIRMPSFSVTSTLPSIMNGGKDFCDWSKQDDLLYATMRKPVETVLGRDGVGLADCAICESKFEKGEDVAGRLLNLVSRLGEIQSRGTPDIEFAAVGLLVRHQVIQGEALSARRAVESLRERFAAMGENRFLPNIDAMLCRIDLRTGDVDAAAEWLREKAPKDVLHLRAMWRYQYMTLTMVHIQRGSFSEALFVLAPLLPYCEICARKMDWICIKLLMAITHFRMEDQVWQLELTAALDACRDYGFIMPAAQYGQAILPLLTQCAWNRDRDFREKLIGAARTQAVYYPQYLKCSAVLSEPLTATETQVLRLLCSEMSNQEIAETLGIKLATVKTHVSHILQKLGVSRRSEAKAAAERLHLMGLEQL